MNAGFFFCFNIGLAPFLRQCRHLDGTAWVFIDWMNNKKFASIKY